MERKRLAALVLTCALACVYSSAETDAREATAGMARDRAMDSVMEEFYQAKEDADEKKLVKMMENYPEMDLLRDRILQEQGLEEYRDITCYSMKLDGDEDGKLVVVTYEMEVKDLEETLAGMSVYWAVRADNRWKFRPETDKEAANLLMDDLTALQEDERFLSVREEVNQSYMKAAKDKDIQMWMEDYQRQLTERIAESAVSQPENRAAGYTVKSGDSLWKIAAGLLGDGRKWEKIYRDNRRVIGGNPGFLLPGWRLVIPE